jgi:hypothetical protein
MVRKIRSPDRFPRSAAHEYAATISPSSCSRIDRISISSSGGVSR